MTDADLTLWITADWGLSHGARYDRIATLRTFHLEDRDLVTFVETVSNIDQ